MIVKKTSQHGIQVWDLGAKALGSAQCSVPSSSGQSSSQSEEDASNSFEKYGPALALFSRVQCVKPTFPSSVLAGTTAPRHSAQYVSEAAE